MVTGCPLVRLTPYIGAVVLYVDLAEAFHSLVIAFKTFTCYSLWGSMHIFTELSAPILLLCMIKNIATKNCTIFRFNVSFQSTFHILAQSWRCSTNDTFALLCISCISANAIHRHAISTQRIGFHQVLLGGPGIGCL